MSEIYMWKSYIASGKRERAALTGPEKLASGAPVAELSAGFASVTTKTGVLERLLGDV
jgi:hypothetical protein